VRDLPSDIQKPISDWRLSDLAPIEYFRQIAADPAYMAAFTRKLYQIHRSLAQKLADLLDLQGARRLLDLGGGSGVISFALLRKYGQLSAVVVDLDSVCRVGRQIARENQLAGRVSYRPADFLKDDLPGGFDVVMLCDVGRFDEALFHKIHHVLDQNGRLVIVDKFALGEASAPPSRLLATFLGSLESPAQAVDYITAEVLQNRLHQAGFRDFSTRLVPHLDDLPWNMDWTVIEVHK
jgi:SAM-dependent methyltransferase